MMSVSIGTVHNIKQEKAPVAIGKTFRTFLMSLFNGQTLLIPRFA